jgi:hypothetical protein
MRLTRPGAAGTSDGRKPRRSRNGRAVSLTLFALAPAVAACGYGGAATSFPAGNCDHFVTTVRTSEPSYARGQAVIVSVTQANEGSACNGIPPQWCGTLHAFASAYNSAGEDVWDYGASKTVPGQTTCPFVPAPGPEWAQGYSNTQELSWSQDECAGAETPRAGQANPNCPGTQVAPGTYRIVGNGTSAPVTITISG